MADMSMNKVIHGAIRRDLSRFVAALKELPPGDRTRATQLATAWENFDQQLTEHHRGEHEIAWPALRAVGVDAVLLTTLDTEHEIMAAALTETRAAMAALARTPGSDEGGAALACFEKLQTVTEAHLDHEEAEIEALYLAKRDTPEIKAMGKAFAKVSPTQGGRFFAWVLDGASADEAAAVRHNVPGPVLSVIVAVFGRSYRKQVATVWQG